jgi:hypothetical protein
VSIVVKNKKIILSIIIIGLVFGAGGFALSQAFFSDTETGTGSEFSVGTLELSVDDGGRVIEPFTIDDLGESRSLSGGKAWTINNEGSLPGRLYFKLDNITNYDNGCNTPEGKIDDTCEDPGPGQGELGGTITAEFLLDGEVVFTSNLDESDQAGIETAWNDLNQIVIAPGESKEITMQWSLSEDDYGNEIQSDSLDFDTVFELVQLTDAELEAEQL